MTPDALHLRACRQCIPEMPACEVGVDLHDRGRVEAGMPKQWIDLPDESGGWQKVFPEHVAAHVERLRLKLLDVSARGCSGDRCIHQTIAEELRARLACYETPGCVEGEDTGEIEMPPRDANGD